MASLIFKDMKRVNFSCSSSNSIAISKSIIRSSHLRDPKRKKANGINANSSSNSNPKSKEPQKNLVSPMDSSRFLLNSSRLQFENSSTPSFIDIFPEPKLVQKPVYDLVPVASSCSEIKLVEEVKPAMLRSFSTRTQDQVVELRVALHCKGCANKIKKHISKIEGVTSCNIDLPSKKVTIIGDVTPLGVLSSVSKVKNAQFWDSSPSRASVSF